MSRPRIRLLLCMSMLGSIVACGSGTPVASSSKQPVTISATVENSGPARPDERAVIADAVAQDAASRWYTTAAQQEADAAAAQWYRGATPRHVAPTSSSDSAAPAAAGPAPVDVPDGVVADAIRKYFGDIFSQAWGVSGCESTHNPNAVSPGGGNYGLFQINYVHESDFEAVTGASWSQIFDPYLNAEYARYLYNQSGWGPWACKWAA